MIRTITYIFILVFSAGNLAAQSKAEKFVTKADEEIRQRNFNEAKSLLRKAMKKDPAYGPSYLKMAGIYNLYQLKDSALVYYLRYVENVASSEVNESIWLNIARHYFKTGVYQKAKEAIAHVASPPKLLKESIDFSLKSIESGVQLEIEELPKEINQYQMQYFPALTVDEKIIFYTKRNSGAPYADEDMVVSYKINDKWIPAQPLSSRVNTPFNEGACSISADGKTLIFAACEGRPSFGNCDLYVTYRQGNEWAEPENLGSKVNSSYWDSQPALSSDGRTLYFSSNRPGGKGGRDLWVARYNGLIWTIPENLGPNVNTAQDETTPFIHANNELLFFSSNGLPGMGGYDLYVSEKKWNKWGPAQNLGYPINSFQDELSLFVNSSGATAYYAKEAKAGKNTQTRIVKFKMPSDTLVKRKSSYVMGRVQDAVTGKPIGASFKMINLNDTTDTYHVRSDSTNGQFFLVLSSGKEYSVFIAKKGYLFEDLSFVTSENSTLHPDTVTINLYPIRDGESVTLENIYFDFDKYTLKQQSLSELMDVAEFIKQNPDKKFRIEGHTDNQGSEAYNLKLSTQRARAVYEYLISKGVPSSGLTYKGFGPQVPVADNDTEEGRKKNRRITFSVVK